MIYRIHRVCKYIWFSTVVCHLMIYRIHRVCKYISGSPLYNVTAVCHLMIYRIRCVCKYIWFSTVVCHCSVSLNDWYTEFIVFVNIFLVLHCTMSLQCVTVTEFILFVNTCMSFVHFDTQREFLFFNITNCNCSNIIDVSIEQSQQWWSWWSAHGQGKFPSLVLVCLPRDHEYVKWCRYNWNNIENGIKP